MKRNKFSFLIVIALLLGIALGCEKPADVKQSAKYQKLESYTIKGLKFSYYKIPANLSREDLIKAATDLHREDADAQLILVDDDSELAAYVKYAKDVSSGDYEGEMPKEWADEHIVANLQKYMSGKFVLCEGYGSREIAEIR